MSIPSDRILSQNHRVVTRGLTVGLDATREVYCTREEVENVSWWPDIGTPWETNPLLRVSKIEFDYVSEHPFDVILKLDYSTDSYLGDDFYTADLDVECDVLDTAESCVWESTSAPVDVPVSRLMPRLGYTVTVKVPTSPSNYIVAATGRLNDRVFHGFPVGTMLFLGAQMSQSLDQLGQITGFRVAYRWSVRPDMDQNYTWRAATQKVVAGIPQFYQTAASGDANYTTNAALESTPVYVTGAAGVPGWDRIRRPDGSLTYGYCDMAGILGLPRMIGDG